MSKRCPLTILTLNTCFRQYCSLVVIYSIFFQFFLQNTPPKNPFSQCSLPSVPSTARHIYLIWFGLMNAPWLWSLPLLVVPYTHLYTPIPLCMFSPLFSSRLSIFHLWQRQSPMQLTCVIWKISWHDAAKISKKKKKWQSPGKRRERVRDIQEEREKESPAQGRFAFKSAAQKSIFKIEVFPFLFFQLEKKRPRTKNSLTCRFFFCFLWSEHVAYTQ